MKKVGVVGTGAWGTALAVHAANAGLDVVLLGRRPELVARLAGERCHPALGGAPPLPDRIAVTAEPEALGGSSVVLWAVSVQATAEEVKRLAAHLPQDAPLIATSKGIEAGTLRRTTQIIADVSERRHGIGVLSGPTFAAEVARALPAAAVVASDEGDVSADVQALLSSPTLRLYRSADVVGVEIAGAAKNVVAIAAGIVDGLKLGQNTRAALITRALAEIRRLGTRVGGSPETFSGLAGIGDLVLTATGDLSRNRRVGLALAAGSSLQESVDSLGGEVAEGVATASALVEMARRVEVELPIAETVVEIISGRLTPREAVRRLMTRELKDETE